ncbi:tRNA pseudouridine(38-40) synthase TruA [Emergencia sp.]|uniref:tRNA pseudouridine(38-40) synthase TruA n=1 Tax=Emergencia sp. TaxID=1926557 RepID=UPI003AF02B18
MERNILLTIEYDGTNFCGWQRQPGVRTVQGELEQALSKVCGEAIKLNGTSRTDAGVHALGQRASFKGEFGIPTDRIMLAANNLLCGGMNVKGKCSDVCIREVKEMAPAFHARFDARGKKYRYIIRNSREMDVFARNYCYQVKTPLDLAAMRQAASLIVGTHDFACFQAAGGNPRETTVRTVFSLDVFHREDGHIVIEITGDGFLYNMVRIIAGTLVEVGQGKINPQEISAVIMSKERQRAGHTAPPEGLYLVEIYYGEFYEREA